MIFSLPKTNLAPRSNRKIILPTLLGGAGLVVGMVSIYMPSGCIQWGQHTEFGALPWRPSCWKCYGTLVGENTLPETNIAPENGWLDY